jgi:hypothetical protein
MNFDKAPELKNYLELKNVKKIYIDEHLIDILEYFGKDRPRGNGDYTVIHTSRGSYSINYLLKKGEYKNTISPALIITQIDYPEYFL